MVTLIGLAAATLVSEDAACLTAAVLIASHVIRPVDAIAACTIGIFIGDVGLWAIGRGGSAWFGGWHRGARLLAAGREHRLCRTLMERAPGAILASRFLPGTRLPLYVAAGAMGVPFVRFAGWSLLACCLWTPAFVLTAGQLGGAAAAVAPASRFTALAVQATGALLTIPLVGFVRVVADRTTRASLVARLARWRRWEFWPAWLFYAPVGAWILWLAIRYRGITTLTAANPGIPDGGTVGESKFDILQALPGDVTIPSMLLAPAPFDVRLERMRADVKRRGWTFPLILKPDVGQRGSGVRLMRSWNDVAAYVAAMPGAILVQPYDPGPFEAGVFYVRRPEWQAGRIFSITDKIFPEVTGDGVSTLEQLVRAHARYRMQAPTFLRRLGVRASDVPAAGERVRLAIAGNHIQGTLFRDGTHLITPALERRIDAIARHIPGFFIGRFDIRYRSVDAFRRGEGLAIVELNGATAESTDIYDPGRSLLHAYRTLFRQWSLVFSIGAANRRRGAPPTPLSRLAWLVASHWTASSSMSLSD